MAVDSAAGTAYVTNFGQGTVSVISSTPMPGPIVAGYHTRTGACIQPGASPAVNGTPAVLEPCHHSRVQDWTIGPDGTIRSAAGLCLDTYRERKQNKTPVDLSACNGRPGQQWKRATGTLVNTASGKCLDGPRFTTPGARLEIYTCAKGANQNVVGHHVVQVPGDPHPFPPARRNSSWRLYPEPAGRWLRAG